jgi:hypothetical protein
MLQAWYMDMKKVSAYTTMWQWQMTELRIAWFWRTFRRPNVCTSVSSVWS